MTTTNWVFWLKEMPTKPGPDGWIPARILAHRLGVPPNHAKKAMGDMRRRGLVEAGAVDQYRHRLFRITGAGLKVLRAEHLKAST